jgi:hypothetical protein
MGDARISRRVLIKRAGVAFVAVAVADAIDPGLGAAATVEPNGVLVGTFVSASGGVATVRDVNGAIQTVSTDSQTYLLHGVDGVVSDLSSFVPGEEVVALARGSSGAVADQLQSVYTSTSGTLDQSNGQWSIDTPGGGAIKVSQRLITDRLPASHRAPGRGVSATIWTDPRSGVASAFSLSPA